MDEVGQVKIETQLQVIAVRSEVRSVARDLGFSTMDQARISLATSTLASLLGLDGHRPGIIRYGKQIVDQIPSLQIICQVHCGDNGESNVGLDLTRLDQLREMLDEVSVESLPSHDIQVTMVLKGRKRSRA